MLHKTLKHLQNVFLLHKRHLAVDLCELRLAVGTQILVAEALGNLEIAVETSHHQKLLVELRRLRKSVELPRIHARRHNEVACTLRSRFNENRGFHLKEALLIEVAAKLKTHLVAKLKIAAHSRATKVEIAILHAQVVATISVILNSERRHLTAVKHHKLLGNNLNVAGRDICILALALSHLALHLNYKLTAKVIGCIAQRSIYFIVKYYLSDAIAVAHIHKRHATHLADTLHPACQLHHFAHISDAKFSTRLSSKHNANI